MTDSKTHIVIGPLVSICYVDGTAESSQTTGSAAQVEWLIRESMRMGFHVTDCRVWAAQQHVGGGFLTAAPSVPLMQ